MTRAAERSEILQLLAPRGWDGEICCSSVRHVVSLIEKMPFRTPHLLRENFDLRRVEILQLLLSKSCSRGIYREKDGGALRLSHHILFFSICIVARRTSTEISSLLVVESICVTPNRFMLGSCASYINRRGAIEAKVREILKIFSRGAAPVVGLDC